MAGVSTPELAGAVSRAGGLGSVAVSAMAPETADAAIDTAMRAGRGLVNVNLFVHPRPRRDPAREAAWLARLQPHFERFGAEAPAGLTEIYPTLDDAPELLAVVCARRPPVISLHFGLPRAATLRALGATGAILVATATSPAEARTLEAAGIDVIVAQGFEAGGHRGHFGDAADSRLPTRMLLPAVCAAVRVPVLAAGGLANGGHIATAMACGAAGAQLGTVYVECPESAAAAAYRQALRSPDRRTAMTPLFSGRAARGLVNRFQQELAGAEDAVPDYPVGYDAGKRLAAAAAAAGSHEYTAMWSGDGPLRARPLPAAALTRSLADELNEALPC